MHTPFASFPSGSGEHERQHHSIIYQYNTPEYAVIVKKGGKCRRGTGNDGLVHAYMHACAAAPWALTGEIRYAKCMQEPFNGS